MMRLIAGRIVTGLLVLFFVATFSHFMLRCAEGGPFDEERTVAPQMKRSMEKAFHLDKSPIEQYGLYLAELVPNPANDWTPNLGVSIVQQRPVIDIIAESFPNSVMLGILSLAFASFFGILLGVFAAARQNSIYDHGAMAIALVGISVPAFVLAPILILAFSLRLGWFPPALFESFAHMVLPALTLGLIYTGIIARLARSGMLEVLRQDYIRTARAKGMSEGKVVLKHAIRLGLLPVVTFLGPATAHLITGSFVVEKIFQIPGLGFYFVESVSTRDYALLSGVLVFYSIFLVLLNLVVDLTYGLLDPRIRERQ